MPRAAEWEDDGLHRERIPRIGRQALRLRQRHLLAHDVRASTIATILYCAWRRLMPSRPIPQSEEITIRSGGMCFSPSRMISAT